MELEQQEMKATTTPKAIIRVCAHNAVIRGVPVDVLDKVLTVSVIRHSTDAMGVLRLNRWKMLLYGAADDMPKGEYLFPAGLAKRVKIGLSQLGFRVQVVDQTRWQALEQACHMPASEERDYARRRWYEIFRTLPRAQIVVRTRRQMVEAISTCAAAHPTARILVITKNNEDACAIAAGLEDVIPDRVRLFRRGIEWCDRIVLVINSYHPVGPANLDYDIVVYVGPETPFSQIGQVEAAKMHCQLRYCIRFPWRTQPTPYEELHLEALCGPVEFVERSQRLRELCVWFVWYGGRQRRRAIQASDHKRNSYFRNRDRNRLVCRIVAAVRTRSMDQLASLGLARAEAERLVGRLREIPGVAIVVESLEHARMLQEGLPQATIYGQQDTEWSQRCPCDLELVTEAFLDRVPIIADVVIRAGGATSEMSVLQGRGLDREEAPQIVIDLWDAFDTDGSARRADGYRRQGAEVTLPATHGQQAGPTRRSGE